MTGVEQILPRTSARFSLLLQFPPLNQPTSSFYREGEDDFHSHPHDFKELLRDKIMNKITKDQVDALICKMESALEGDAQQFEDFVSRWQADVSAIFAMNGDAESADMIRNAQLLCACGEASSDISIVSWNRKVVREIINKLKSISV